MRRREWLLRAIYLLIAVAIAVFLFRQGEEPWILIAKNWQAFCAVAMISSFGLLVQATTFRECLPQGSSRPAMPRLLRIWAIAGAVSLAAPLIAGLALRTTMLRRETISIHASVGATLRQTWLNIESATLLGSVLLLIHPWAGFRHLEWVLFTSWILIWGSRRFMLLGVAPRLIARLPIVMSWSEAVSPRVQFWLWGQIAAMAMNYAVAYGMLGASLTWLEAGQLAILTVLASVIVVIPNGLGVLDGIWLWVGHNHGLDSATATAVVLTLRLGYLCACTMVWATLAVLARVRPTGE